MTFLSTGRYFLWELEVAQGREFLATLAAPEAHDYWPRALRAVERSGILVITFHHQPIGILGGIHILSDVLFVWRGMSASQRPAIETGLAKMAAMVAPRAATPFQPRTMGVRMRPPSLAKFLRELDAAGSAALVFRGDHPCAILMPIGLLQWVHLEMEARRTPADEVLSWVTGAASDLIEPLHRQKRAAADFALLN